MYQDQIRTALERQFPNVTAYFQAADITSQVLNFGLPAAIDVQISGNHLNTSYDIALKLADRMRVIPGVKDLRIAQPQDYPSYQVNVDRAKALQFGITQLEVASSLLASLSGASLLQPNFWLDPVSGVNYNVIAQMPQHLINSLPAMANIPLSATASGAAPTDVDTTTDSTTDGARTVPRFFSPNCSVTSRPSNATGTPRLSRITRSSA